MTVAQPGGDAVGVLGACWGLVAVGLVGRIPTMNSKQVIKQLEADGWYLARVKGSHHQFKHPSKPGLVTVKHPDGDIPTPTLYSIQRQAGWRK